MFPQVTDQIRKRTRPLQAIRKNAPLIHLNGLHVHLAYSLWSQQPRDATSYCCVALQKREKDVTSWSICSLWSFQACRDWYTPVSHFTVALDRMEHLQENIFIINRLWLKSIISLHCIFWTRTIIKNKHYWPVSDFDGVGCDHGVGISSHPAELVLKLVSHWLIPACQALVSRVIVRHGERAAVTVPGVILQGFELWQTNTIKLITSANITTKKNKMFIIRLLLPYTIKSTSCSLQVNVYMPQCYSNG